MTRPIPSSLRRALHWSGSGLAMIGIAFVGFRLHAYWGQLDLSGLTPNTWSLIVLLALVYGSANLLLAFAWWHLLRHLRASQTRFESVRIYGMSQLAKYVPGNIFHLAGRQALGMATGLSAMVLVKSTFWELGLIAVAGVLFGWMIWPLLIPGFPEAVSVLLLLVSIAMIAWLLHRLIGIQPMWAFLWQVLFLLVSGVVFAVLLALISGGEALDVSYWLTVGAAYIVAWLVGLATPGAPGGVGVREMILLLLLKNSVVEADLLMVILLGRLVTIVGDFVFFVAASLIPAKSYEFERKDAGKSNLAS